MIAPSGAEHTVFAAVTAFVCRFFKATVETEPAVNTKFAAFVVETAFAVFADNTAINAVLAAAFAVFNYVVAVVAFVAVHTALVFTAFTAPTAFVTNKACTAFALPTVAAKGFLVCIVAVPAKRAVIAVVYVAIHT